MTLRMVNTCLGFIIIRTETLIKEYLTFTVFAILTKECFLLKQTPQKTVGCKQLVLANLLNLLTVFHQQSLLHQIANWPTPAALIKDRRLLVKLHIQAGKLAEQQLFIRKITWLPVLLLPKTLFKWEVKQRTCPLRLCRKFRGCKQGLLRIRLMNLKSL